MFSLYDGWLRTGVLLKNLYGILKSRTIGIDSMLFRIVRTTVL
jgi:hypothetical protein